MLRFCQLEQVYPFDVELLSAHEFTENVDFNASLVIKKKGIRMQLAGELSVKQKKRSMRLKKKEQLGQELSEDTCGEIEISRTKSRAFSSHPSVNREPHYNCSYGLVAGEFIHQIIRILDVYSNYVACL